MGFRSALIGILFGITPAVAAACAPDRVDLRGPWGQIRIAVDVADTAETRAQGLMFVENLPPLTGMLFVYDAPQPVAFWMRNTLIPLDMLFFDASGQLIRLHENAIPLDETPIPGGQAVQYVLEVPGGTAAQLRIQGAADLRHPSVDQESAAWGCD